MYPYVNLCYLVYPYFDATNEKNVTSFVGQVTYLHCTVRHIRGKTVSWIRKSNLQVLTSDVLTFTEDQRFSAHHTLYSDSWTLQIKYTQLRDEGEYQCQVNTEPKISFAVYLTVKEAVAQIDSPTSKEVHVNLNSAVKLSCMVELGTGGGSELPAVFWYLNGEALDLDGVRWVNKKKGQELISTLIIEKADNRHTGMSTFKILVSVPSFKLDCNVCQFNTLKKLTIDDSTNLQILI